MRPLPALLLLAAALVSSACARNPVSGRREPVVISKSREMEMGLEETARVEKYIGLVRKPELVEYVRSIGERVAKQSPRQDVQYEFHVVDELEPNAFVAPGGQVFVTRGLLALTNSEDEVACVIGHEIGHVAARHAVRRATYSSPFTFVTAIPGKIVGLVLPDVGEAIAGSGELVGGLVLAPYSRSQEREADRLGQRMAARAGWNPAALSSFLYTLTRDNELKLGRARRTRFFDSHPGTPERVRDTERTAMAIQYRRSPIAPDHLGFLGKLDGLRVGPNAEFGVFVDNLFLHPVFEFRIEFPAGWDTMNQKTYVAASMPGGEVGVVLELAGEGDEPRAGAIRFQQETGIELHGLEELSIGGLPALHATAERRRRGLDLTWIAYEGEVFQIAGVGPRKEREVHRPGFRSIAGSFGPLAITDRSKITELRLRIKRSTRGESVEAFLNRTRGLWSVGQLTVANALWPGKPLDGRLIKVPTAEPFFRNAIEDASLE